MDGQAASIGHNNPPPDVELDVQTLEANVATLAGIDLTEDNVVKARALVETEVGLRQRLDTKRKLEVEPHLAKQREVNGYYNGLIERGKVAVEGLKKKITAYLLAIEEQRLAEARRAAEAAEAAEQKAVEEEDPFASFDAVQQAERTARIANDAYKVAQAPARISGGGSRSRSLRTTYAVRVTGAKALVAHFGDHPKMLELATQLAQAQVRAASGHHCNIAGIRVEEERKL